MRNGVLVIAGLVVAQPVRGQTASADSAAIVALELEMSRLLAEGRVDEYATHLTSDYARTTREGKLERRDAALASGAHWVSTDYADPDPRHTDYTVELPGGIVARCNPVNPSAFCRDTALEP